MSFFVFLQVQICHTKPPRILLTNNIYRCIVMRMSKGVHLGSRNSLLFKMDVFVFIIEK